MGSATRSAARLATYVLWTAILIPVQWVLLKLRSPAALRLPKFYHLVCTRILGFDLQVIGRPSTDRPTLFVSNHSSYLDITILGALIEGSFVAKSDVAAWPFFGTLARLQRTVFVDRKRSKTAKQRDSIQGRLQQGDGLILFPEGTSSDGNRTLPFKSALFSVAAIEVTEANGGHRAITVQPVSIACTALDGIPLGRELRPLYAWYGDMSLVPHLWIVAGLGRLTVAVEFHAPVRADQFASRKALAEHCYEAVSNGVAAMITGRPRESVPSRDAIGGQFGAGREQRETLAA